MNILHGIVNDLREKRLWPVAVALLVAIVAVPVVLAKSASPRPSRLPATTRGSGSATPALPSISVDASTTKYALTGLSSRDPFTQQSQSTSTTTTASGTTSPTTGAAAPTSGSTGTGSTGGAGTSSGGSSVTTTTTTTTTSTTTPPPPSGLTATEAYHVVLGITNSSGGLDTIDPLERLSLIPSSGQPLLVELGVLQGGNKVLFVVQPGAVLTGPGVCMPGPIDCQILSLGVNQTETLSQQTAAGVNQIALFAVTSVSKDQYRSADAADAARKTASGAGLNLLSHSTLSALSLFPYDPNLGTVVDLRNLTVGGG